MGRVALSKELYDLILQAHVQRPGNHLYAEKQAGITRAFSKKTFEFGWPQRWPEHGYGRPIREVLDEMGVVVRAARFESEALAGRAKKLVDSSKAELAVIVSNAEQETRRRLEEFQVHAFLDSAETVMGEATACRQALSGAVEASAISLALLQRARQLCAEMLEGHDYVVMTNDEKASFMRNAVAFLRESNASVRLALEVERIRTGEPIAIPGIEKESMTEEQAKQIIRGAAALASRDDKH